MRCHLDLPERDELRYKHPSISCHAYTKTPTTEAPNLAALSLVLPMLGIVLSQHRLR